ncbi:zinc finger MYM-type-like protein [Rhynchospora pubera]|uniref:Zinc finger MYM-type-like protein n=1 Tax=Rhynchospora pubera TaxID=906938 RepID=A0AAV8DT18_9POAL|nr:zinc finger MYM-type-like protein [Rhynchospora pubera]
MEGEKKGVLLCLASIAVCFSGYSLYKLAMEKYYKRILKPRELDEQKEHEVLMKAVVDSIHLFLCQGWAYEGIEEEFVNDIWGRFRVETVDEFGMLSSDRRMFVELLELLGNVNKTIDNVLVKDVSMNNRKLTSQSVQREMVRICAKETINYIFSEIGDSKFSLMLDSWRGVSWHLHVSLVVRFVDKTGVVIERFLGTILVPKEDHTASALKRAIEEYLRVAGIQLEKLRCHSYNGSSVLCKTLSDLREVFLEENKSAYCIHCLSHQLQMTFVEVGKFNIEICMLFMFLDGLHDLFKDTAAINVKDPFKEEELAKVLQSANGIIAAFTSERLSYHNAIVSLIADYSVVLDLLEFAFDCGFCRDHKLNLFRSSEWVYSFEFALSLHLMRDILSLTDEISQLLEMRENDIEKAVNLTGGVSQKLEDLRDHGWELLFNEVSSFCKKNEIEVPDMAAMHPGRPRHRKEGRKVTNFQYYHDGVFLSVVETQIKEINKQFTETNTSLILCIAAMNPKNSFFSFNKENMVRFAKFFPCDFSPEEIGMLDNELEKYIIDMRSSLDFKDLDGITKLAEKLVLTRRAEVYPLVYRVIELALIIPIAAPAIERVVSSGKVVKKWLTARLGNEWLNDCLVTYIEQDIFRDIGNEVIIKQYESSKSRLGVGMVS